jgi:hypothetical protein
MSANGYRGIRRSSRQPRIGVLSRHGGPSRSDAIIAAAIEAVAEDLPDRDADVIPLRERDGAPIPDEAEGFDTDT